MDEQVLAEEKTYRLNAPGRRTAYLLLVGSAFIWLFALWTLKNTLKIGFRPQNLVPSLKLLARRLVGAEGTQPLTAEESIPAIVMLVLLVVVPLLIWTIIEELRTVITVNSGGITFRSLGIELAYPWREVAAVHPVDEEEDEPLDELVLSTSHLASIPNPLVRFLHWQAYGRHRLPLYGGLENRGDLLQRIQEQLTARAGAAPTTAAEHASSTGSGMGTGSTEVAATAVTVEPFPVDIGAADASPTDTEQQGNNMDRGEV